MHGGDIYRNKVDIDLSTNINPLGCPEYIKEAIRDSIDAVDKYPDHTYSSLRNELRNYLGLKDSINLEIFNGASEFISSFISFFRPSKALLLAPSFIGYKRALEAVGTEINWFYLKEENKFNVDGQILNEIKNKRYDVLFITNPNNPTGRLINKDLMERIIKEAAENDTVVIVDECFLKMTGKYDESSVLHQIEKYDNLICLNAFTKTFAIPGVRLGWAAFSKKFNDYIKVIPEWNISTIADSVGRRILSSDKTKEYIKKTLDYLEIEKAFFRDRLKEFKNIKYYDFDADFVLIKTSIDLYQELLKRKILIRDCSDYTGLGGGFYRIAIKSHEESIRLFDNLKEISGQFI